jgi:ribosome recycling factor
MTNLDKRKLVIKKIFDRLPAEEQKEAIEVYGDDILRWHDEYLKKQEMTIKAREDRLRKLGVNIDAIREKMHKYLEKQFGGGDD